MLEHKLDKIFEDKIKTLKSSNFLVALSGGVDSMVLANLFLKNNLKFNVAHCNFNLRSEESDDDEIFVSNWSQKNNIKYFSSKFSTTDYCEKFKLGIQEGARNLRYEWFYDLKRIYEFDFVITAHNLDDQIETYLINSMRGTGLNGLVGITEKTESLYRPLLNILKDDIVEYATLNSIDFREDSSNLSNDYFRNKIRNTIISEFKNFDDNVMLKFKTTMNNLNSTKIFVDSIIGNVKDKYFKTENKSTIIEISEIKKLHPLEFYIHNLFLHYGFDFKEVIKLFNSDSGKYIESEKFKLTKNKKHLIITKND